MLLVNRWFIMDDVSTSTFHNASLFENESLLLWGNVSQNIPHKSRKLQ